MLDAETIKKERCLENLFADMIQLKPYLDDTAVTDIFVLDSGELIVKKFGTGKIFTGIEVPETTVRRIIYATASSIDKNIVIEDLPKLEAFIPKYNYRLTGILPPAVRKPILTIRKHSKIIYTLEDYVAKNQLSTNQYDMILEFLTARKNIVIGGQAGAGKTTFLNALIHKMCELTPHDNFYIVEDVPEIQCRAKMKTILYVPREKAAEAVATALRLTPDRIIFGELRYGQVVDELLKAWRTASGSVTTIHGISCISMMKRMRELIREVTPGTISPISEVVHLLVHLDNKNNMPFVDEVLPTHGIDTDNFLAMIEQNNLG